MVGNPAHNDKTFKEDQYEEFYEDHHFQPLAEEHFLIADEVIPRFGWAFDKVEEVNPDSLLDLGCLDGSFALTVSDKLGISTTGIDLTRDGIRIATERAENNGLPATFHQGTIEDWLEKFIANGEQFGMVTCFEVLEHVKDPVYLLTLIDQVLLPGGSVLISTPSFESPLWGADDEQNKCHIRLYTTKDEDYEKVNKYGTLRKATSITKQIGKKRIVEMGVYSELINVMYR